MTNVPQSEPQRKHWLRLWHDMPTDPKFRVISRRSGRPLPEVIAVFVFMLTNASANTTERGELDNWCDDDVAAALDMEPEHVAAVRDAMQGKTLDGDRLMGWERRQPKREDSSTERVRAHRERRKTPVNADETQRNAPVTHANAQIREEEIREEKNTPPFVPPSLLKRPTDSKRGSRLPAGWSLPADWMAWAEINFSSDRAVIQLEADRFRDFWIAKPGQAGCKLDWQATWRNWCRNARLPATNVKRHPASQSWQDRRAESARIIYDLATGGGANA